MTIVPSDSEEEDRMFVEEIMAQIKRDERRSAIVRVILIACFMSVAFLCGAAWATYALGAL